MNFALVCFSTFAAVAIAEVGVRLSGQASPLIDPGLYVHTTDSLRPYALARNYSGKYGRAQMTTDADGFRMVRPRIAMQPPDTGTRTLLLLGDSHIFGLGVADHETTASQLQDSLTRRGLPIRVVNIGVPGYTSWNEYAALKEYLETHHVDEVLLSYISNDPTFDNGAIGQIEAPSPFHRATRWVYERVYITWIAKDALDRLMRPPPMEQLAPFSDAELEYSMTALERIRELCASRGISFTVMFPRDLYEPRVEAEYERRVGQALNAHRFRWFMSTSAADKLTPAEYRVTWSDGHPSAKATALIVGDIVRYLARPPPDRVVGEIGK